MSPRARVAGRGAGARWAAGAPPAQAFQPCSQKVHQKTPCSENLSEVPDLGLEAPQAPDEGRAARKK